MLIIRNNMIHYGNFICVRNMFLSYSFLLSSFVFLLPTVPFFFPISPTSLFFSMAQWVSLGLFTGEGKNLFTELCASYHWLHHWRQSLSLPHYLFPMDKPQTMMDLTSPSPFHDRSRLVEILCRSSYLLWLRSAASMSCPAVGDPHCFPMPIFSGSYIPLTPSMMFPELWRSYRCPLMTRFSTAVFFSKLWVSEVTTDPYKKMFLWPEPKLTAQKCSPYE